MGFNAKTKIDTCFWYIIKEKYSSLPEKAK